MNTPANPIVGRPTIRQATAALGCMALIAGGFQLAPGQAPVRREPAARLLPPKPITSTDSPIISRGLDPDQRIFDPSQPVLPANSLRDPRPTGWSSSPAASAVRSSPRPTIPPRPNLMARPPVSPTVESKPSLLDRTWSDVKDFFGMTPTAPPVAPAMGPVPPTPYTFVPPTAPRPNAVPANVYAGPPAYRWYGWGTTTPGANPFAPDGQHPRGSANWFAQTGATPGAFPVPVSGAALAFGASPPSYTGLPTEMTAWPTGRSMVPVSVAPSVSVQPPMMTTYPMIGLPTIAPHPSLPVGSAMPIVTVPTGSPVPLPVAPVDGAIPETSGPTWQRSGDSIPAGAPSPVLPATSTPASDPNWGPAKESVPIIRGQGPADPETPTVESLIRAAGSHRALVTEIRPLGPARLLVKLTATNESEARLAADAIARVRQLQPYAIQFEVKLGNR